MTSRIRKFKIICASLCLCLLTIMLFSLEGEAKGRDVDIADSGQEDSAKDDIRNQILQEYENDEEFQRMLKNNPDVAAQYVESLVEDLYKISQESSVTSANSNGTEATCTVPVKTQTKSNNCSAATILQTLYGLGKQSKVVGATDSAKQNTIFNNYTTNTSAPGARNPSSTDDTLTVSEVTVFLNKFVSTHKYQYKVGKNLSQPEFESLIWNSLVHDRPVLLHARTEFLEYYKGNSKRHYLSLD